MGRKEKGKRILKRGGEEGKERKEFLVIRFPLLSKYHEQHPYDLEERQKGGEREGNEVGAIPNWSGPGMDAYELHAHGIKEKNLKKRKGGGTHPAS